MHKLEDMITDNVVKLLQQIKQRLEVWDKLHLSWFGRVAVIKTNGCQDFFVLFCF